MLTVYIIQLDNFISDLDSIRMKFVAEYIIKCKLILDLDDILVVLVLSDALIGILLAFGALNSP